MTLALGKQPDISSKIMIKGMEIEKRVYTYQPEDGPLYGVGSKTQLLFPIFDSDQYISIELLGEGPEDINITNVYS